MGFDWGWYGVNAELFQAAAMAIDVLREELGELHRSLGMPPPIEPAQRVAEPAAATDDTPLSEIGLDEYCLDALVHNDPPIATVPELGAWMEAHLLTEISGIGEGRMKTITAAMDAYHAKKDK